MNIMRTLTIIAVGLFMTTASAQENVQPQVIISYEGKTVTTEGKTFTTLKELPITSVKNQYRSGTCWDFATLGYLESEILRKTGKPYYLVKNSWGTNYPYKGTWYMSRDYIALNTTYLFLNRHALSADLQKAVAQ